MTEEQNKLAEELEIEVASSRRVSRGWVAIPLDRADEIIAALRREPATEAVLEEAAKICEATGMWAIHGANSLEQPITVNRMFEETAAAIRALKGKGASQGVDELMCPMTAQICYDPRAQCKPGHCRRQLAPEPSGEMSDQHRILLGAAISISNALHNEEMRGAKLKASTDTAWEKLSLAIEHSSAILAPMSRRDEDAKR